MKYEVWVHDKGWTMLSTHAYRADADQVVRQARRDNPELRYEVRVRG
jgi:hypothetical protein